MSVFRYNGVELLFAKTLRFAVTDEKDPSGADQLWRVYDVQVRGIVSGGTLPTNGPAALLAYHEALTTPRQLLYYKMGGTEIINTTGIDARYGPDAPTVELDQVVEGVIFATVSVKYRSAACAGVTQREVVSCRWTQTEEIDGGEWLTSIVTRGILISRTDLRRLTADSFRESLPIPLPPNGFVRRYSFTLGEDGTRLAFELRDQEHYTMPPSLAVEASGTFAVTSPKPGAIRFAAVSLTLKGPPGVSRNLLMAQAFGVAWAKLKTANLATATQDKNGRVIVGYTAVEDMYRNIVQVSMQANMATVDMDLLSEANQKLYGTTPGSANTASFAPPVRRAIGGLLAAAFRDPCLAGTVELTTAAGSSGASVRPYVTLSTGNVPNQLPSGYTPSYRPDRGGYDWYNVLVTYDWDEGRAGLPGTGVGATPKRAKSVQVHGGLMLMLVDWSVKRRGNPPVLPSYQVNDPNLTPLRAVYVPKQNDVNADQTPAWDVAGRFVYLVLDPDAVSVLSARPPYLSETVARQMSTDAVRNASTDVFAGIAAAASGGGSAPIPGADTVAPAGGSSAAAGPNPVTGTGVVTNQEPEPTLARELTAAERSFIDAAVADGANRAYVTNDVLNGVIGPLAPGQPPVNP